MPTIERLGFKVNGQTDEAWLQDLQEIVVEHSLHMPSMCTITLYDGIQPNDAFLYMESSSFKVGAEILVSVQESSEQVFRGEIVALEPLFREDGSSSFRVRAYDKSHRLHRGKLMRTYLKQKYSDVITSLLQEVGIQTGTIADTRTVHEFLILNNQTRMEWIAMVADLLGFQYFMADGKFHFKKADDFEDPLVSVEWRDDLRSFYPHVTTTNQPSEVAVYAWDQVKKVLISGKNQQPGKASVSIGAVTQNGGAMANSAFDEAKSAIVRVPVPDADTAQAVASGHALGSEGQFIRADGVALGTAKIKAGRYVEVKGAGTYSGKYFVTTVRHVYRYDGRWETHFSINGRNPTSLLSALRGTQDGEIYNNRINGVVSALVTNSRDPLDLGRVKVKYPFLVDGSKELESDWVRVAAPGAGKTRGFFWVPEVNDEVVVAFENGDPHRPYVLGALWNQKDNPPAKSSVAAPNGVTTQRFLKSRTGHTVLLDDSDGAAKIQILDSSGKNEILIDTKQNSIQLMADKDITLSAKGNITLDAKGKVEIKSGADTTITATAAFKVDAKAPSEIKTTSPLTIDGATVTVKATGSLSLTANGAAELKAAAVVSVQGALIKLN